MTVTIATDKSAGMAGQTPARPVYLDFNATTPVDRRVAEEVMTYLSNEFGNAGSRTHTYGQIAKERVNRARTEVATVVSAKPDEVVFTSGATESDNLALLGLAAHGIATGRRHIISTQIEHKAVLEPLEVLSRKGFEVELLPPHEGGWVSADQVAMSLRPDTLLVSVMAVNNETGVIQPLNEIAAILAGHEAYFHVDAAQAFGKLVDLLREPRIDLMSLSGHKIGAPKGIGALLTRRRGFKRPPLEPLMHGGGQERGLRPGTLPVALIAGLGMAAKLAAEEASERTRVCQETKRNLLKALEPLDIVLNGDPSRTVANALNFSVPGIDSEAAIVALKDVVAISNGSACTSQTYEPSHVLTAAGLPEARIAGALRLSWGAETTAIPFDEVARRLASLQV
ncbi:cysteine desulfurase DndA [Mycobacterium sp. 852013-50091_SCH5140682]|uniref:cysteine desulfurase DndA n=1 Tax=Mycobacterium sp. 852013-50091_SCH5140682 TaxID=1834109 RepID=UPI0007E943D8|nr:cysteine desulfurase DndA [Mycobacterium sp. 852013-50091_SCH5140682]OBC03468.1 cysteine desulfurase DndA [Mycobacterium sp. 852013-50091_SCH5140682]